VIGSENCFKSCAIQDSILFVYIYVVLGVPARYFNATLTHMPREVDGLEIVIIGPDDCMGHISRSHDGMVLTETMTGAMYCADWRKSTSLSHHRLAELLSATKGSIRYNTVDSTRE
jgi:hypothetical protein